MVVADHLAIFVNIIYANPQGFNGPTLIMGTLFFAFQLYCDFSGYTDIALGSAQVMGINLIENFQRPYFSKSIAEFWRRWHISLSSWLRDYVYFPIARSTKNLTRTKLYGAIIFTFFLIGLWHGAGWNYVIMGLLFGFYITFSEMTKKYRSTLTAKIGLDRYPKILNYWRIAVTFVLVCIGWVFFRVNKISDAWYILSHWQVGLGSFIAHAYNYYTWKNLFSLSGLANKGDFVISACGIAIIIIAELIERQQTIWQKIALQKTSVRWLYYYAIIFALVIFARFGAQQFIYFQF